MSGELGEEVCPKPHTGVHLIHSSSIFGIPELPPGECAISVRLQRTLADG